MNLCHIDNLPVHKQKQYCKQVFKFAHWNLKFANWATVITIAKHSVS